MLVTLSVSIFYWLLLIKCFDSNFLAVGVDHWLVLFYHVLGFHLLLLEQLEQLAPFALVYFGLVLLFYLLAVVHHPLLLVLAEEEEGVTFLPALLV